MMLIVTPGLFNIILVTLLLQRGVNLISYLLARCYNTLHVHRINVIFKHCNFETFKVWYIICVL